MATTDIVIPSTQKEREQWIGDVGTVLTGGNDARIVDESGNEVDIAYINISADGNICCRAAGQGDGDRRMIYLVKGGWHSQRACKFYTAKTTASVNALVKGIYKYN